MSRHFKINWIQVGYSSSKSKIEVNCWSRRYSRLVKHFYLFFKVSKNSEKKFGYASTFFVLAQKISLWKDIFYDLCKKDKNMSRTKAFCSVPDLSFLHRSQKMSFYRGFFCANMKYMQVCPDLFLEFFDIWKMVFWAVGAAAPMTRSGFPLSSIVSL